MTVFFDFGNYQPKTVRMHFKFQTHIWKICIHHVRVLKPQFILSASIIWVPIHSFPCISWILMEPKLTCKLVGYLWPPQNSCIGNVGNSILNNFTFPSLYAIPSNNTSTTIKENETRLDSIELNQFDALMFLFNISLQ